MLTPLSPSFSLIKTLWLIVSLLTISACNYDQDHASAVVTANIFPPHGYINNLIPTPLPTTTDIFAVHQHTLDLIYKQGESIELALVFPRQNVTNIHWQQIAGPQVPILAPHQKVIAFTANELGDYQMQATFTLNGQEHTSLINFSVIIDPKGIDGQQVITARLGHAALETTLVTLRAHFNEKVALNESILNGAQVSWQQVSNLNIPLQLATSDYGLALSFTAPNVSQDQLFAFEVSATYQGETYRDLVAVVIEDKDQFAKNGQNIFNSPVTKVTPYKTDSAYAKHLQACVYSNAINSCTFDTLALIGQQDNIDINQPAGIDDIMARVLVSHPWMAERFQYFLEHHDPHNDFKHLLKAVTAIVISSDIRPSYYHPQTGAIYLDPNDLWLTAQERDTINEAPDYRTDFGNELQFLVPSRLVKNNLNISKYYSKLFRINRQLTDNIYSLSALLYHELAHANDYYPSYSWQTINNSDTFLTETAARVESNNRLGSALLAKQLPLFGDEMYALAAVNFHGKTASKTQKAYMPDDIASFFKQEAAPKFYSYSTIKEDFAVLFDSFMMKARYNIDTDVAITNVPQGDSVSGHDYIVTWGQRGRIAEPQIKPRVKFVVNKILPHFSQADELIEQLTKPIAMTANTSWLDNLAISPASKSQQASPVSPLAKGVSYKLMDDHSHKTITLSPEYIH